MSKRKQISIVMLSGYLQSGKDTVGEYLCETYNFKRYAYADALKDEVAQIYHLDRKDLDSQAGKMTTVICNEDLVQFVNNLLPNALPLGKKITNPVIAKLLSFLSIATTIRTILIQHGQMRREQNPDYWVEKVIEKIKNDVENNGVTRAVITDWRFPNESSKLVEEFKVENVRTWRIDRWDAPPLNNITETALDFFQFQHFLKNEETINHLQAKVDHILLKKDPLFPILLTDIDDVLLKWIKGFKTYVEGSGYTFNGPFPPRWTMAGWITDPYAASPDYKLSESEIQDLVLQFNHSELFETLQAYPNARKVLQEAKRMGYHIIAISSCTDNCDAITRRKANLNEHFSNFIDTVICLPLGCNKKEILSSFTPSIWLDDNVQNATIGAELGHFSYVMERPWNKDVNLKELHTDLQRISDWNDLLPALSLFSKVSKNFR